MIGRTLSRIILAGVVLTFLALSGCAADWWSVDESAYVPPSQSADQTAEFAGRAPVGESHGGEQATGAGEGAGDTTFQPHPAH